MVLNNLPQMFVIYFPKNYFYPEVIDQWEGEVKKLAHPYMNVEDFINSQIKSITFPGISTNNVKQQSGQYPITKRTGKEADALVSKNFTLDFKLTESYLSWLVLFTQYNLYLHYINVQCLYWPPIVLELLNDQGFSYFRTVYSQITPKSITEINFSYSAELASYKSFKMSFDFNYIDYYTNVNGKWVKLNR